MPRGATAARLRALRQKYRLGEYSLKRKARSKTRKQRAAAPRRRRQYVPAVRPDPVGRALGFSLPGPLTAPEARAAATYAPVTE